MITPRVLCVMLANGRQAMVERALRSFASQTYEQRRLLVFDSGERGLQDLAVDQRREVYYVHYEHSVTEPPLSIGSLRNLANGLAAPGALECDLIAHWDSDDWSHPLRLEEQVEALTSAGVDCVGYRDMLFWDSTIVGLKREYPTSPVPARGWAGGAWLYRCPNPIYMAGTSMLYTRKIWEKYPFQDRNAGEDTLWQMEKRIKRAATSSLDIPDPRMVAAIHGNNTAAAIQPGAKEWTRAESADRFCRLVMEGEKLESE